MQVRRLRRAIARQADYLHGLRDLMSNLENLLKEGRSTTIGKQVEALVTKIVAAEEKLQWLEERLEMARSVLRACIVIAIADEPLQRILILRYVQCLTWTQISKDTGLSRRQVYRLHKKFASQLDAH